MLYPAIDASPDVAGTNVVSIFMSVVLPAPFGPINPKISPRPTDRDTPSTAVSFAKRLVSASMQMTTSMRTVYFSELCCPSANSSFLRRFWSHGKHGHRAVTDQPLGYGSHEPAFDAASIVSAHRNQIRFKLRNDAFDYIFDLTTHYCPLNLHSPAFC